MAATNYSKSDLNNTNYLNILEDTRITEDGDDRVLEDGTTLRALEGSSLESTNYSKSDLNATNYS